jgi:hypothetical protein
MIIKIIDYLLISKIILSKMIKAYKYINFTCSLIFGIFL